MEQFEARRTKAGALVACGPAPDVAAAVGELVELVAPNGATAYARIRSTGRIWTAPDGHERCYGYVDPGSITAGAA